MRGRGDGRAAIAIVCAAAYKARWQNVRVARASVGAMMIIIIIMILTLVVLPMVNTAASEATDWGWHSLGDGGLELRWSPGLSLTHSN